VLDTLRHGWPELAHGKIDPESGYRSESLLLKKAVETAHSTVHQVAQSQPQCAGMGTTIVLCLMYEGVMSIAYVGDSRLYRLRGGKLEQITRDHSLVEELVARGHYTREDAQKLVRRNIVTRAVGIEPTVQVDLIEDTLENGDILLLCSDGLTDMVDDPTITATLAQFVGNLRNLGEAASELVAIANKHGGKDNVSVALARIESSGAPGKRWFDRLLEWF